MGKLLSTILIFAVTYSFGADNGLKLRSFVKQDTVLLKWVPETPEILKLGLINGYELKIGAEGQASAMRYAPWSERKAEFLDNDYHELVDQFITSEKDFSYELYFLLMVGSGPNKDLSKMLGIYWEDITPRNNEEINYSIQIMNHEEYTADWKVNSKDVDENLEMSELSGSAKPRTGEVYLSWNGIDMKPGYSGYWIQKSEDGKTFKNVNETPWVYFVNTDYPDKVNVEYVDTSITEGETYYYRIQGINHFADLGDVSNTVEVKIPRGLNGITVIDTVEAVEYQRIIKGEYREGKPKELNYIGKFYLFKSDSIRFGYELVGEAKNIDGSFEFTVDSELPSGDRQYFKVAAIGIDQDTAYSFPYYFFTLDQEPPILPTDFKGEISDSGIVSLTWLATEDRDIRGYRIFRSNSLNEEFVEVTKELDPKIGFSDTLSLDNLTSEIYYKLRSVDKNFNNSEMSEPILILKPDYIAPVPARITYYNTIEGNLEVGWVNSSSEDVAVNYLMRTSKKGKIDTAYTWKNTDTLFVDSVFDVPGDYNYHIITQDEAGNKGESKPLIISYEPGFRKPPGNISATRNIETKTVDLAWNETSEKPYAIYIYRAGEDEKYKLVETLYDYAENAYSDADVAINNIYHYKIRVMFESGISTKMTEGVKVVF